MYLCFMKQLKATKIGFATLILALTGCYSLPERDCAAYRTGSFEFVSVVEGDTLRSSFERFADYEIDFYEGKTDTSNVKWINDCEFVLRNQHPKSISEQQAVHIKILSTDEEGYSFEYGVLKDTKRLKGYARALK
jgi:hypothetical protein